MCEYFIYLHYVWIYYLFTIIFEYFIYLLCMWMYYFFTLICKYFIYLVYMWMYYSFTLIYEYFIYLLYVWIYYLFTLICEYFIYFLCEYIIYLLFLYVNILFQNIFCNSLCVTSYSELGNTRKEGVVAVFRAHRPMVRVPKVACGMISQARGIHCSANFVLSSDQRSVLWITCVYRYASYNDGATFWEMRR